MDNEKIDLRAKLVMQALDGKPPLAGSVTGDLKPVYFTGSEWGLYTATPKLAQACAEAADVMNDVATVVFAAEGIERLNKREVVRVCNRLYHVFSEAFGALGAGDTEGRYAVEDAAAAYLKAHGLSLSEDVGLDGDFLLWEG